MENLITVYIPTKNRLDLLKRAVNSVLSQTHRPIELIIVSDGSDDGTCDYVNGLDENISIALIHNETSVGACAARNQAIQVAHGEFITGLDDDDIFLPHRLATFLAEWRSQQEKGVSFSCLFDRRIVNAGDNVALWDTEVSVSAEQIVQSNAVGNQVFTTPQRMKDAGGFDPAMPAWQDWDMWVRLIKTGGPAYSIQANTYIMDISHEFERITKKSSEKIIRAAHLFYQKHCQRDDLAGLLYSLAGYDQIRLTLRDMSVMLRSKHARFALQKIRAGKFRMSLASSIR
ncbi:glycosyltransferase involved in cell wall biosynthesis [Massilia sp. MP_M2]|uniref:glycosyltransferase n=1 Tax=Massilia sp. MP_M2 TaxID=3071713 RepID=UPI00319DB9AC